MEFGETIADRLTNLLKTPNGKQKLRPVQAAALYELGTHGGLFGPIPVGHGKTLISLLAAYVLGAERPLLVLPAALIKRTNKKGGEKERYAKHWRIPTNIQFISYEMLGRVQAATFLEELNPDFLIFDEVHRLKNKHAAVTRRLLRFMKAHPNTKVMALSGTVMKKSLLDFGHILRWCLKHNAPIPTTDTELEDWAQAIDEKIEEYERADLGALKTLSNGVDDIDAVRRGFRDRLISTPGVVAVTGGEDDLVSSSLRITALKYDVAPITEQHFAKLRADWLTPDDWQLKMAVDVWRHSRELSLGFHYCWTEREMWSKWLAPILQSAKNKPDYIVERISNVLEPMIGNGANIDAPNERETTYSKLATALSMANTTDSTSAKRGSAPSAGKPQNGRADTEGSVSITITERGKSEDSFASPAIAPSGSLETLSKAFHRLLHICLKLAKPPDPWRNARRDWSAFVRETLSRSRTLDSELQVVQACDAGRLPNVTLEAWRAIRDSFTPNVVAMWHDDSAIKVCLEWMKQPGIVWTEHDLFARRLAEVSGCKYFGAKGLSDDGEAVEDTDHSKAIILSIDANKEGRNLQEKWSRNLITAPPEGADIWQQMLGRTHRPGQLADEVEVDVLLGCKEHANAWRRALAAAESIRDTTGADSKLLFADVIWPSDDEIAGYAGARWR